MINKKEYKNKKEKIADLCIGFFGMFAAIFILSNVLSFLLINLPQQAFLTLYPVIILVIYTGSVLFFYKKRKYISIGILVQFFVAILIGLALAYFMYKNGS
ncbi:hypothetical protein BMS3Abin15_00202 [bacterium BMS3Abin15]|nr:hypothetical protein BMS3Abin15_00202 [bacterium BMS3Abin15]HDZ85549.1 hypothetical protein [Candidatus Moranbacteria bacterium]